MSRNGKERGFELRKRARLWSRNLPDQVLSSAMPHPVTLRLLRSFYQSVRPLREYLEAVGLGLVSQDEQACPDLLGHVLVTQVQATTPPKLSYTAPDCTLDEVCSWAVCGSFDSWLAYESCYAVCSFKSCVSIVARVRATSLPWAICLCVSGAVPPWLYILIFGLRTIPVSATSSSTPHSTSSAMSNGTDSSTGSHRTLIASLPPLIRSFL